VKTDELMGLSGVFETRNQVTRLTFNSKAFCEAFLEKNSGVHNVNIDGKEYKITVKDSNIVEKFVRVTGIPYTLNLGIVKMRLREYGEVFDLRWERFRVAEDEVLFPVLSTWLIVRMSINKEIPSYVTIGDYRAFTRYHGQIPTCKHCDGKEHFGKDCPSLRRSHAVVISDPVDQVTVANPVNETPVVENVITETVEVAEGSQESSDTNTAIENLDISPIFSSSEIPAAQPVQKVHGANALAPNPGIFPDDGGSQSGPSQETGNKNIRSESVSSLDDKQPPRKQRIFKPIVPQQRNKNK
jgi:hypothetical protein